ncbi:hypothetical protein RSAG8_09160, partial [Rhizoctonia solani AG-8 WAC10335]
MAGSDSQANPIRYPNCLAHVCSRWRAVALSSPSLWTHIDLTSDISIGGGFLDRACAYVERAGKLPLEVHLDDKGCAGDHDYYDLGSMIQSLSSRVKELDFVITAPKLLDFHGAVLNSIFPDLSPKGFKKLRMSSQASLPYPFLSGSDGRANSDGHEWSPNILKWQNYVIDGCFSGVNNIHLQGIFFAWSRKLYHGLVDLRLTSSPTGRVPIIGALDLIAILLKSPELRILHFSLGINMPEDTDNSWSPVSLPNLEVVRVSTSRVWSYAATLFRLLKPGSKPLRLTLETGSYEPLLDRGGLNEFVARSKVERLCIRDGNLSMNELRLCNLPDLKVLVFDSCHQLTIEPVPTSPSRWNSCLIHATRLNLYQLRSIPRVVIKQCARQGRKAWGPKADREICAIKAIILACSLSIQIGQGDLVQGS